MKNEYIIQLKDELISDEGIVYHIYKDHLGHKTFGVGHLITRKDPEYNQSVGSPVSHERIKESFREDVNIAINDCVTIYKDFLEWPGEVQIIIANMAFNLGRKRLETFVKMKSKLEERDWVAAAREGRDSRWYQQVTNRAERLMSRLERCYLIYE